MYLFGRNGILLRDPLTQLRQQREGNIFLVQFFLLTQPTTIELRRLVDCHEYLQVTTLADITSVHGKEILL